MTDDLHIHPMIDVIAHEMTDACPCGPTAQPVKREDGSVAWLHHSLDGREQHEPGLIDESN